MIVHSAHSCVMLLDKRAARSGSGAMSATRENCINHKEGRTMKLFYRKFPFQRDSSVTPFHICHITYPQNLSFSAFFRLVRDLMSKVSSRFHTHCGNAAGYFPDDLISFSKGS